MASNISIVKIVYRNICNCNNNQKLRRKALSFDSSIIKAFSIIAQFRFVTIPICYEKCHEWNFLSTYYVNFDIFFQQWRMMIGWFISKETAISTHKTWLGCLTFSYLVKRRKTVRSEFQKCLSSRVWKWEIQVLWRSIHGAVVAIAASFFHVVTIKVHS